MEDYLHVDDIENQKVLPNLAKHKSNEVKTILLAPPPTHTYNIKPNKPSLLTTTVNCPAIRVAVNAFRAGNSGSLIISAGTLLEESPGGF